MQQPQAQPPGYTPKPQTMRPEPPRRYPIAPPVQRTEQRAAPAPARRPLQSQPQPRPSKPQVQIQQPRAQAPVMTAPRAVRPERSQQRVEFKGPPVQARPQAQPQPQRAQPQGQKVGAPAKPAESPAAKGGGRKKP
jgi:hypothetical protein